ncbi:MAG TPA: autotransporter domain-containing protein, partial [Tardiphaga sp.]
GARAAGAADGTWVGATTDWNSPANWTSSPDIPNGTATFSNTGSTTVDSNSFVFIGSIQFTAAPAAPSYTINNNADFFFISGAGVFNYSASPQTFNVLGDGLSFLNSSTASGGTGAVSYINSSFLNFLDASSAGSATITNGSVLQFAATSTAATAQITNNATMDFFDNSTAGTAHITNAASGALTFNNSSSAQTATIANAGAMHFNNSSLAGTATVTNDGTLDFNNTASADHAAIGNNATMSFSGSSSAGNAGIANAAVGTLTFNDTSTARAATIVNDGAIAFNNSSRAGTATVTNDGLVDFNDASSADHATIANNAAITFNGSSTADHAAITYGTVIASTSFSGSSSAGNATFQTAPGSFANFTTFFDASTARNASIANASGVVQFTDSATAGSANISNTGSLVLGPAYTTFSLASSAGSATITNNFMGLTRFEDQSLAGTATIINNASGATMFGAGGASTASADHANIINAAGSGGIGTGGLTEFLSSTTAGNATITTRDGGGVFFFETSSGGTARFITEAGGAFDISQLTAAGMTAGSIEGAGTYYLGDRQLTVGGNNLSTTVSGVISDGSCGCFGPGGVGGSLVKVGSGTLTLSGVNLYTGATDINGGTLSVNGSIALSSLTVNTGGTLGGNGIVGNTLISGGTLSPGNSIGTLTVQGSLVFTAAASYLVEASTAASDLTRVTGTATLGGATVNASFAPGSYVARQYTIVSATGGVIGSFASQVNTNLPSNFTPSLVYDANNAYLKVTLDYTSSASGSLNTNQRNVANALVNSFNANASIPLAFGTLTPAGLTLASGELATGVQQTSFDAMNLFLGLLTDPFVAGRGDPFGPAPAAAFAAEAAAPAYASSGRALSQGERDAYAAIYRKAPAPPISFEQRWSVWAAGFGGSQTTQGNSALGSAAATDRVYGAAVGADYRISPATLAGFALAGGGTSFGLADRPGSGRSDLFQAGAFVRHAAGPAYLSAALAYGWQDVTTDRSATGADRLLAQFNPNAFSGRLESGYRLATPAGGLTPYAAGQFTTLYLPAYAEQAAAGPGTFALSYSARDVTASRSELGLRSDASAAVGDGLFTLRGRLAWAHNFNTDRTIGTTFQTLPGASFVVAGAAQAHDSALTSASAEMQFASGLSLAATFEGEFSDVSRFYAGKGVVRYAW